MKHEITLGYCPECGYWWDIGETECPNKRLHDSKEELEYILIHFVEKSK